jgi:prophage maintenance system killer protein
VRTLDLADLVVIAGRALELDSDAVLELLDLEAADAALAASRAEAGTSADRPERVAAVLLVELVRRRPLARGNGQVALLALAQLLALNDLQIELDAEGTTELLNEVAAGVMGQAEVRGWLMARRTRPEAALGKEAIIRRAASELQRERGGRLQDQLVRFTPPARRAVVLAQAEAGELGQSHIGTEHLLLVLLGQPDELAAKALASLEVTPGAVRALIERIVGGAAASAREPLPVPFAPRVKQVLELATHEALRRGQPAVRCEHLLLALLAEGGKSPASEPSSNATASPSPTTLPKAAPRPRPDASPRRGLPPLEGPYDRHAAGVIGRTTGRLGPEAADQERRGSQGASWRVRVARASAWPMAARPTSRWRTSMTQWAEPCRRLSWDRPRATTSTPQIPAIRTSRRSTPARAAAKTRTSSDRTRMIPENWCRSIRPVALPVQKSTPSTI